MRLPIPSLRQDLEARFRSDGTVDVRDPRLLQIFTLDADDYRLAQRFDGRTAEAVASALGNGVTPGQVVEVAEELDELSLLDTPEARAREPDRSNLTPYGQTSATRRRLRVLPEPYGEPRWGCQACGACCHGLTVEVSRAEEARIDPSLYPDILQGEPFAEWSFVDPDQPARRVLRQVDERRGACIFLDEGGLCSVHARQGMEAKPDACQIFPHVVMHVPGGPPRLTLRLNCESMHETHESGPTTRSQIPDVVRILKTHPAITAPREVEWFGETIAFREYDAYVQRAIDHLETSDDVGLALQAIDDELCERRARRARRGFGRRLPAYLKAERSGPAPVEEGGYGQHVQRLKRWPEALAAMAAGRRPPRVSAPVGRFLTRQLTQALYGLGPLHWPDAGFGLTGFVLAGEAILHAVGPRGRLKTANTAFSVFTAPLLETTHHAWPMLEAIDEEYVECLKEEL